MSRRAFIAVLYSFRKSIMRSTGKDSLAGRDDWIPPSFQCKSPPMLNWWVRCSWVPPPPGEWVCLSTPGMETCQTTVRVRVKKPDLILTWRWLLVQFSTCLLVIGALMVFTSHVYCFNSLPEFTSSPCADRNHRNHRIGCPCLLLLWQLVVWGVRS